ncbi:MAG TPA: sugar MFS transporter [Acidobacteriaceae bacterium]|nr:sugar MFS transporter [Acidobacteriaceae bacterium]
MVQAAVTKTSAGSDHPSNHRAMAMVTTLFFVWGFLTALNDILVPHLKSIFELNYARVMLINSAFFGAYFVFAIPSALVIEKIGYKKTMVVGLLIMALGAILFVPAANVPSFELFLAALIVLATGVTALQVAANPYVTVLGPARTASSRLNLTQAFNSLGTTIAPYVGGMLILSAAPLSSSELHRLSSPALLAYRQHEASSVKLPYIGITVCLVALALAIAMFKLPKIEATREFRPMGEADTAAKDLWKHRQLVFGTLGIFLYVGAEVAIGSFLINYFTQPEIGNLSVKTAASLVSLYWFGAMVGRFIGAAGLQKLPTRAVLGTVAVVACLLVTTSILSTGWLAMATIIAVGLFNSVMFPSIFALGVEDLGPLTAKGSGMLVQAIVGGAIIPVAEGALADHIGIHHAFILPALCYVYIAFYGFKGSVHKVQNA